MKKIILAPDSFKGTLSAEEVCRIEREAIKKYLPEAELISLPMADGGEGMVNSFLRVLGGTRVEADVTGPLGEKLKAAYGILPDGSAVMEMAAAAGLPLVRGREDPLHTTTRGVGELILDAERRGIKKILLGLGGSCTNDCGAGMAGALGFRFYDSRGAEVEPAACNLEKICCIAEPERMPDVEICAACDVSNPLSGPNGAVYTFSAQKGADREMQEILERGVCHFERVLEEKYGTGCAKAPGTGAAGGMGAGVLLMLKGELKPGTELLLEAAKFDEELRNTCLVITGEGRIDWQSAAGKVPAGVGLRCKKAGVPCLALCGSIGRGAEALYDCGISAIFSAVKGPCSFEEIKKTAAADLGLLTESVIRTLLLYKME
ncbi:MAG: glycerate kinase [Candidatus Limivicinus sp.]|jgi:glycerate kinase